MGIRMSRHKRKRKRYLTEYRYLLVPVVIGIAMWSVLHTVLLIGYVPSRSMSPAIEPGNYILASRIYGTLKKGDIIVFRHEGEIFVKRIAAVEGDRIRETDSEGMTLIVPEDCYYVLGDNAEMSVDSRHWKEKFVHSSEVAGRVIGCTKSRQEEK